ncbi:MAG: HipA domain-containing protein [Azoarcus sp.]|jgi:serine/threonine-protein kinase HipA|nr:HipA domain-containing protein [Azoarcus sp.]
MTFEQTFYVWNYLPGATRPVVAGRLQWEQPAGPGWFVYGRSYLERGDALPLDPCVLPLRQQAFEFRSLNGYPGVVLDACPDFWGQRVIDRLCGPQAFPAGYLLLNDPGRVGSLAFSRSATEMPQELQSREFSLDELLAAARAVEQDQDIDPELLKALQPGTGGVRPKCTIEHDGALWIAKFASVKDPPGLDMARLEHATMRLARACGINAAETQVIDIHGGRVCLVRRFDRAFATGSVTRIGFISARSLFYADPAFNAQTGSYGRIARWLGQYGGDAGQKQELYRRMVFNCAVRNTDDHELNHGLLQLPSGNCRLSPAYDVLPASKINRINHHALQIGNDHRGTVDNLLAAPEAFALQKEEARDVIEKIEATIQASWRDVCYEAGLDDEALRRLERHFSPLPRTG